ncbi:MAG: hypothetical protein PHV25_01145 [Candidatus Pacebacteria bacterium]|nr:hypothetical protein [Candidatus Paceibacterota bacterium]
MEIQKKIISLEDEQREIQRRTAIEHLDILRNKTINFTFITKIRVGVQEGDFTLRDIGTTEEELEQFWVNGCKISARECLNILRQGTEYYDINLRYLRSDVEDGKFSLGDIETTEEELEELRIRCARSLAHRYLELLRLEIPEPEFYFKFLNLGVENGDFTLGDIGTTEEELEELRHISECV